MANNPQNINLGPCAIVWGANVLGYTIGGVTIDVKTSTKDVTVDQRGTSKVNEYITGRALEIKMKLAETDLDTFYTILMNVAASQPSGTGTGVYLQTGNGIELVTDAAPMLLHPINAKDNSQDIYFPGVSYTGNINFDYKFDQVRSFDVTFIGYADPAHNFLYYGNSVLGAKLLNVLNDPGDGNDIYDRNYGLITDRVLNPIEPSKFTNLPGNPLPNLLANLLLYTGNSTLFSSVLDSLQVLLANLLSSTASATVSSAGYQSAINTNMQGQFLYVVPNDVIQASANLPADFAVTGAGGAFIRLNWNDLQSGVGQYNFSGLRSIVAMMPANMPIVLAVIGGFESQPGNTAANIFPAALMDINGGPINTIAFNVTPNPSATNLVPVRLPIPDTNWVTAVNAMTDAIAADAVAGGYFNQIVGFKCGFAYSRDEEMMVQSFDGLGNRFDTQWAATSWRPSNWIANWTNMLMHAANAFPNAVMSMSMFTPTACFPWVDDGGNVVASNSETILTQMATLGAALLPGRFAICPTTIGPAPATPNSFFVSMASVGTNQLQFQMQTSPPLGTDSTTFQGTASNVIANNSYYMEIHRNEWEANQSSIASLASQYFSKASLTASSNPSVVATASIKGLWCYSTPNDNNTQTQINRNTTAYNVPGLAGTFVLLRWSDIETSAGVYDFSSLHTRMNQMPSNMPIILDIIGGFYVPSFYLDVNSGPIGTVSLTLVQSGTSPSQSINYAKPYDINYVAKRIALMKALKADAIANGYYNRLVGLKCGMVHVQDEEMWIGSSDISQQPNVREDSVWASAGYKPSLMLAAWESMFAEMVLDFPNVFFTLSSWVPTSWSPWVDETGTVVASNSQTLLTSIITAGVALAPNRFGYLDTVLSLNPPNSFFTTTCANFNIPLQWQMNDAGGNTGGAQPYPGTPDTPAYFTQMIQYGQSLSSPKPCYIELHVEDVVTYASQVTTLSSTF